MASQSSIARFLHFNEIQFEPREGNILVLITKCWVLASKQEADSKRTSLF